MTDPDDVRHAVNNAAALWTALAEIRGHDLVRHPAYLVMDGDDQAGRRILTLTDDLSPTDIADITALAHDRSPVAVEDAFDVLDLSHVGKTRRYLPVMIRRSADIPASVPGIDIARVTTLEQLEIAERVVVEGFDLPGYLPWRPGEAFPVDVLKRDDLDMFTASIDGTPVGACFTLAADDVGGMYWVTTLPTHRSRGVGRALVHASLAHLDGMPVTLSASRAGKPLYDSLCWQTLTNAAWWS